MKASDVIMPSVGSKWRWAHLTEMAIEVIQVIEKEHGRYVLYDTGATIRIVSAVSWHKMVNGQRPYLSTLLPV